MPRVKLLRSEIEQNDLPLICMVCGQRPAETKRPTLLSSPGFPLTLFGLVGTLLSPCRVTLDVYLCGPCRSGFVNEVSLGWLWQLLKTVAVAGFAFMFFAHPEEMPENLAIPGLILIGTWLLQGLYHFGVGKKYAIRIAELDKQSIALNMPSGQWGVLYTAHRKESGTKSSGPPRPSGAVAPPPAAPAPVSPPPAPPQEIEAPPAPFPVQVGPPPTVHPSLVAAPVSQDATEFPEALSDLFKTVKMGDTDLLEEVLRKGADLQEQLPNGMNSLHMAAVTGNMQMVSYLIAKGLPVNAQMAGGLTAMHLAVQCNNQSVVGLLLAKKADPNQTTTDGMTPLHWCASVQDARLDQADRYKMALVLARGGGDLTARDGQGRTPAEIAQGAGHDKVAEVFSGEI